MNRTKEKEGPGNKSTYKKWEVHWLNEAMCFVLSFRAANSLVSEIAKPQILNYLLKPFSLG